MEDLIAKAEVNRAVITERSLFAEGDDREFWHSQTPGQRMEAAELMRQMIYGYNPATERLQRVLRIVELGES